MKTAVVGRPRRPLNAMALTIAPPRTDSQLIRSAPALMRKKALQRIRIDGFRGLIAQSTHERHQMWGHRNGLVAQTDDQSLTDFSAERRDMDVVDLIVFLVRRVDHEISDLLLR